MLRGSRRAPRRTPWRLGDANRLHTNTCRKPPRNLVCHMARDRFRTWIQSIERRRCVQVGGLERLQHLVECPLELMEVEGQFIGIESIGGNSEIHLPVVPVQHLALAAQEERMRC